VGQLSALPDRIGRVRPRNPSLNVYVAAIRVAEAGQLAFECSDQIWITFTDDETNPRSPRGYRPVDTGGEERNGAKAKDEPREQVPPARYELHRHLPQRQPALIGDLRRVTMPNFADPSLLAGAPLG
jgi:hypothetical protein